MMQVHVVAMLCRLSRQYRACQIIYMDFNATAGLVLCRLACKQCHGEDHVTPRELPNKPSQQVSGKHMTAPAQYIMDLLAYNAGSN
jgi:hypothetical protein